MVSEDPLLDCFALKTGGRDGRLPVVAENSERAVLPPSSLTNPLEFKFAKRVLKYSEHSMNSNMLKYRTSGYTAC